MLSSVMAAEMVVFSAGGAASVNSYCAVPIRELSEEETSVGERSGATSVLPGGSSVAVALRSDSVWVSFAASSSMSDSVRSVCE